MNSESERGSPIERLTRPLRVLAANKVSGAVVLLIATAIAILWANSPWSGSYDRLFTTEFTVGFGEFSLHKPLLLWINDGLMGIFFFLIGLEIKREFLVGELSTTRKAVLPVVAAVGGMAVPAALYMAFNHGREGFPGWGIPMATDIAFALGVLALLGTRVPMGLKVFLTGVAIVDDLGAVLVIAIFYTDRIYITSLVAGGLCFALSILANRMGVRTWTVYLFLGMLVWLAFLKSGVHATLAAVLMALTIPARTRLDGPGFHRKMEVLFEELRRSGLPAGTRLLTPVQHHILGAMERTIDRATAPLQRLEHELVPLVAFVVMPVFALANAGVALGAGSLQKLGDPISLGIICGLFLGKQIGVFGSSWLAVRLGWAELPSRCNWRQVHAVAVLSGIGFTMSLFIGGLAFPGLASYGVVKVGVLVGSTLSAVVGAWLLHGATPPPVPGAGRG